MYAIRSYYGVNVFVPNLGGFLPDTLGKQQDGCRNRLRRTRFVRVLQIGIQVGRELGIDGQIHGRAVVCRELDRIFYAIRTADLRDGVGSYNFV